MLTDVLLIVVAHDINVNDPHKHSLWAAVFIGLTTASRTHLYEQTWQKTKKSRAIIRKCSFLRSIVSGKGPTSIWTYEIWPSEPKFATQNSLVWLGENNKSGYTRCSSPCCAVLLVVLVVCSVREDDLYSHCVIASGQGCTLTLSHTLGFWIDTGDFCMCFLLVVGRARNPCWKQLSEPKPPHWLAPLFLSSRSLVLPPGAGSALPHSNWLP